MRTQNTHAHTHTHTDAHTKARTRPHTHTHTHTLPSPHLLVDGQVLFEVGEDTRGLLVVETPVLPIVEQNHVARPGDKLRLRLVRNLQ